MSRWIAVVVAVAVAVVASRSLVAGATSTSGTAAVNAVLTDQGVGATGCAGTHPSAGCVVPLYSAANGSKIGFVLRRLADNGVAGVTAVDARGAPIWATTLPDVLAGCRYPQGWTSGGYCNGGGLFGGFDYDGDGVPDVAVVEKANLPAACGSQTMQRSWLGFLSGRTGAVTQPLLGLVDVCFGFLNPPVRVQQWKETSVLFGPGTTNLGLFQGYADGTAWDLTYKGTGFISATPIVFPGRVDPTSDSCTGMSAAFDAAPVAQNPPWSSGHKFVCNAHIANGLIVSVGGTQRLVYFTSYRVVQDALGPTSAQLIRDHPFMQGNSVDPNLAGRNYGFVGQDPANPRKIVELAGADAATVYRDMVRRSYDPADLGEIERHVAIYDVVADTTGAGGAAGGGLDDRGYGTIHDYAGQPWANYRNRLVYPANPFVAAGAAAVAQGGSRLAYNVLGADLRWHLHITYPGSTRDRYVLDNQFLWDIRDVDGDGTQEWLISPTRPVAGSPDMPAWQTTLYRWLDGPAPVLKPMMTFPGVIPFLVPTFRTPTASTSRAYLFPALTVDRDGPQVLMERQGLVAPVLCNPVSGSCS